MGNDFFNRQILLFGEEGQTKIEKTHVGIVGLGGTGSHVVQQLSYLGAKKYTLIENDTVEDTNLNRLIGATPDGLQGPTPKIVVAERMIRAIRQEPNCTITAVPDKFPSIASLEALKKVDIIFGCVDKDGPRLILTEFSAAYEKPYIDVASEINPADMSFGGRVFFSVPGKSCLHCRGELSLAEVRKDLQDEVEFREDQAIYGVPKSILGGSGPSVVSLNGVVSSLAVTEFMVYVTGIRQPKELLVYDGTLGSVKHNTDKPIPNCYYCNFVKGMGDRAQIKRYIRKHVSKIPK